MPSLPDYFTDSRRWESSILLLVPLLLLYEIGLFITKVDYRNSAEILILNSLALIHPVLKTRSGLLALNAGILIAFLAAWGFAKKRPPLKGTLLFMMAESVFWSLLVLPVVVGIKGLASRLLRAGGPPLTMGEEIVLGLGAGLYEELLFRLVLIAGGYVLLVRTLHVDPLWAQVSLVLVSALLFSGFHHMGPMGEPYAASVFVFRFLAGVFLGLLYVFRGLAIACWAHALYDVWIVLS